MPPIAPATLERLRSRLPGYAAIDNPIDTTAITLSDSSVIDDTLLAVAEDSAAGLVVLPHAIDYAEVTGATARRFVELQSRTGTPIPLRPGSPGSGSSAGMRDHGGHDVDALVRLREY